MPDSAPRALIAPEIHLTRDRAPSPDAPDVLPRGALHHWRRRLRWVLASAAVALLMMSRVAAAGPRVAVSAGSCPNRDAMIFALAQVLPTASIVPPTEALLETGDPMAVVTVADDGASYQVQVGNIARTFSDPPARCEDRAGKAAIVVALALEPPQFVILQPGPAPAPPPPGAPQAVVTPAPSLAAPADLAAPVVPAPSAYRVWMEAGGAAEYAWPFDYQRSAFFREVTARVAVERGDVGLVLGAAWPGWVARTDSDGMSAERIPVELLLRLRHPVGPVSLTLESGPALVFQRTVDYSTRSIQTELDLRAAARIELRSAAGYGAFVALTAARAFDPAYIGASTPMGWLGASAGLMMQVR